MDRVIFLIDGFNLYHSLKSHSKYHQYRWLDLRNLCSMFLRSKTQYFSEVFYFTALAVWSPEKVQRHKTYIRALLTTGVQPVYGDFKVRDKKCRACGKTYRTHEEKMTDVSIAIHLLKLALQDRYDTAIILSGDSDLIPSIQATKQLFPSKKVGMLFPINRALISPKNETDFHFKIKEKHLRGAIFPYDVVTPSGDKITCPAEWGP